MSEKEPPSLAFAYARQLVSEKLGGVPPVIINAETLRDPVLRELVNRGIGETKQDEELRSVAEWILQDLADERTQASGRIERKECDERIRKWRETLDAMHQRAMRAERAQESAEDRVRNLEEALQWALEWIDAVPEDAQLPAMPGFDRDYVDGLLIGKRRPEVCDVPPEGWTCSRTKGHSGPCAASPVGESDLGRAVREVRGSNEPPTQKVAFASEKEVAACHKCGLPKSVNPHPEAGKPPHYLEVGCPTECIPCTVKSRHSWANRALRDHSDAVRYRTLKETRPYLLLTMLFGRGFMNLSLDDVDKLLDRERK
jgi:hypothetical protein